MEITGKNKVFFGIDKQSREKIYISKPTWDCGWYWSFGYLGNKNCHYHLSSYANGRNINMYEALLNDYELAKPIYDDLWQFCELSETIYTLKETAAVLGSGGSRCTENVCKDIVQDKEFTNHLNNEVLPKLLQTFWNLIQD